MEKNNRTVLRAHRGAPVQIREVYSAIPVAAFEAKVVGPVIERGIEENHAVCLVRDRQVGVASQGLGE